MVIKFEDCVSKITFHDDTPEEIAMCLRSWANKSQPLILQKKGSFHKPSNTIIKKWR
jgi:hypothetical protein